MNAHLTEQAGAPVFTMPPMAPLAMPVQDLNRAPAMRHAMADDGATPWRRFALIGAGILTATLMGGLSWWRAQNGLNLQEIALISMVGMVAFWIALSATTAVVGLRRQPAATGGQHAAPLDVALLMPIYHEDPGDVMAAALAMLRDLASRAPRHRFCLYLLSDTRGEIGSEVEAFAALRRLAPPGTPVFYRWRPENTDRKSGNVADWLSRWGGAHDAMVVLDADSLMGARTLLAMTDEMAAAPNVGLIQSSPRLIGAKSLFARAQAFAGAAYGPLLGRGLARWSGDGANFWGHNAIIRTRAFAASAGLPKLPRLFGKGADHLIWSHDFVEAALLRRRGWAIRLRPDLHESFEETPPSLVDHILRDRRWCQGNLQHLRLLGTAGLTPLSRLHLLHGAASYLVSPGWMVLLIGWTLMCFAHNAPTLTDHGGWAVLLATYGLLLLPKVIGLGALLLAPAQRRRFGGAFRLTTSAGLELILSILYAPCLMVQQTITICRVTCGATIGWAQQNRGTNGYSLAALTSFHRVETLLGIGLVGLLGTGVLSMWLVPVALSLIATVPLSALSARRMTPKILSTPQDLDRTPVQRRLRRAAADLRSEIWNMGQPDWQAMGRDDLLILPQPITMAAE